MKKTMKLDTLHQSSGCQSSTDDLFKPALEKMETCWGPDVSRGLSHDAQNAFYSAQRPIVFPIIYTQDPWHFISSRNIL